MGYTDQQVADAIAKGYSDVESMVQYLLSVEPVSKAPAPSAPPPSERLISSLREHLRPGMIAATQNVATERLKSSLREHLTRHGYREAHIEKAISLIDFEDPCLKLQTAYTGEQLRTAYAQCVETIVQLESRPPKAMGSTLSYRDSAEVDRLKRSLREHLTRHGYREAHIEHAISLIDFEDPSVTLQTAYPRCV